MLFVFIKYLYKLFFITSLHFCRIDYLLLQLGLIFENLIDKWNPFKTLLNIKRHLNIGFYQWFPVWNIKCKKRLTLETGRIAVPSTLIQKVFGIRITQMCVHATPCASLLFWYICCILQYSTKTKVQTISILFWTFYVLFMEALQDLLVV